MITIQFKGNISKEINNEIDRIVLSKKKAIVKALKEATPVDTGYAQSRWRLENNVISNDAEYIDNLNKGSSKQAPAYFIEKTLLAQEGIYPSGTIVRST